MKNIENTNKALLIISVCLFLGSIVMAIVLGINYDGNYILVGATIGIFLLSIILMACSSVMLIDCFKLIDVFDKTENAFIDLERYTLDICIAAFKDSVDRLVGNERKAVLRLFASHLSEANIDGLILQLYNREHTEKKSDLEILRSIREKEFHPDNAKRFNDFFEKMPSFRFRDKDKNISQEVALLINVIYNDAILSGAISADWRISHLALGLFKSMKQCLPEDINVLDGIALLVSQMREANIFSSSFLLEFSIRMAWASSSIMITEKIEKEFDLSD